MRPGKATATPLRLAVSASRYGVEQLGGTSGPVALLGAFGTALYLQLPAGTVLAVLTSDAVRLPIGLVLPRHSNELPLDAGAWTAVSNQPAGLLQDGVLRLAGLELRIGWRHSSALRPVGAPRADQLARAAPDRHRWETLVATDLPLPNMQLGGGEAELAGALLGRGPGLTPSGDDLLCGLLAGGRLFGRHQAALAEAVLDQLGRRPRATTSLSRQLLLSAAAGDGIEQVSDFAAALCRPDPDGLKRAAARLGAVGHSSGAALGLGVLLIAEQAARTAGRSSE